MQDLWYKNAIIYCVDVETFMDGNGDGVGDFLGLTQRLDHIAGLGVTCIWLLPFSASPNRDNGYDVSDYYAIDPRLGTFGDFVEFMHLAEDRGIRVIADLVINHTSCDHPWFRAACADRDGPARDFYIWSRDQPADLHEGMVFPGVQDATWTWSEEAGAWYFHRFYKHMPDLNMDNPVVREELRKVVGFWLQLGVSGFRIDAAPFVIETPTGPDKGHMHFDYFQELRGFAQWRRGDTVLLAEANVTADEVPAYFGEQNRLHMMFNFIVNQRLFLALAREEATPVAEALSTLPGLPLMAQWTSFLRNHDELDLGRLNEQEREDCFAAFAPREDMRIYGRGIRRRLAPMLGNDRRRLELAYSLMFSLPGTPVLWYGEEIGMGEDLSQAERSAVRTPMQWADQANGGFSPASPERLVRPLPVDGTYGYRRVNVAGQQRDRGSLMVWIEHTVRVRRDCPEIGWGAVEVLDTGCDQVLAHRCRWQGRLLLALHNFSDSPQTVAVEPLVLPDRHPVGLLEDGDYSNQAAEPHWRLNPYGFRWLRLEPGQR